jgi:hypothetical protein
MSKKGTFTIAHGKVMSDRFRKKRQRMVVLLAAVREDIVIEIFITKLYTKQLSPTNTSTSQNGDGSGVLQWENIQLVSDT